MTLFMDMVQLPHGYRATTRREFTLSSKQYYYLIVMTNQEVKDIPKVLKKKTTPLICSKQNVRLL